MSPTDPLTQTPSGFFNSVSPLSDIPTAVGGTVVSPSGAAVNTDISSFQVQVGPDLGTTPGALSTVSISQALADFYTLPKGELITLEEHLWQGGFYRDSSGSIPTRPLTFGTYDPASFAALKAALIQASMQKQDLGSVIDQNIQAGVGEQSKQVFQPGIIQHGYRTVVSLANPEDVAYLTDQIFQKYMGRYATTNEKNDVYTTIRNEGYQEGLARYAATEQMYKDYFNDRVNQRQQQEAMQRQQMTPQIGAAAGAQAIPAAPIPGGVFNGTVPYAGGPSFPGAPAPQIPGGVFNGTVPYQGGPSFPPGQAPAPPGAPAPGAPGAAAPTANVDSFLAAVKAHESGGDYQSQAPGGAGGAYGFIPETWNSQATAAGFAQYANGQPWSAPPAVQDAVARYMAMNAFNGAAGGDWLKVADVWYIGHVASQGEINQVPHPEAGNRQTVSQYEQDIAARMGQQGGGPSLGPNFVNGADQYVPGSLAVVTSPASAEAEAYKEARSNPVNFEAAQSVNVYQSMLDLINQQGPAQ
jgi:hypothetical protein